MSNEKHAAGKLRSPKLRQPRVLWANLACLLDTSSGASMTIREMLKQLSNSMIDVSIIGATNFDSERGTAVLKSVPQAHAAKPGDMLAIKDDKLVHNLFATANIARNRMPAAEEMAWHMQYVRILMDVRPDLVFFYGGFPLDYVIADEARVRGIPTAAYVANPNYNGTRWCRDVDLILTDSAATAKMYEERNGLIMKPVGKFINSSSFVSETHTRKNVVFINPSPEKGVGIVLGIASILRTLRPDILIEVVESRGKWADAVARFKSEFGNQIASLPNIVVTPHATDMRPIYGRARLLLAPGLWWESSGRILAEAMLNAIPAIITNRGGMPEMIRDGGIAIDLPDKYFEKPFTLVPKKDELEPFVNAIIEMYDNEETYQGYVANARQVGKDQHHISVSTRRLIGELKPLLDLRAGDGKLEELEVAYHKHHKVTLTRPS